MKKQNFIALFVSVQIILLFLQIHQHTIFINQSFAKQKNEKIKAELEQRKQEVAHELAIERDYETIQKFAEKKLHMRSVALSQIKKLPGLKNESGMITVSDQTHTNNSAFHNQPISTSSAHGKNYASHETHNLHKTIDNFHPIISNSHDISI